MRPERRVRRRRVAAQRRSLAASSAASSLAVRPTEPRSVARDHVECGNGRNARALRRRVELIVGIDEDDADGARLREVREVGGQEARVLREIDDRDPTRERQRRRRRRRRVGAVDEGVDEGGAGGTPSLRRRRACANGSELVASKTSSRLAVDGEGHTDGRRDKRVGLRVEEACPASTWPRADFGDGIWSW